MRKIFSVAGLSLALLFGCGVESDVQSPATPPAPVASTQQSVDVAASQPNTAMDEEVSEAEYNSSLAPGTHETITDEVDDGGRRCHRRCHYTRYGRRCHTHCYHRQY